MTIEVDHLVVAAATLEDGIRWCEATLGVVPAGGGQHPLMGTHNRLVNLSSPAFPRCYLEIIAIDLAAAPPGRARWFGLDDPALQAALAATGPRLHHVVARTADVDAQRQALLEAGYDAGVPVAAHRDTPAGRLQWRILVRDDGALLAGGLLPTLIEWDGPHPADALPPQGLALQALRVDGLPAPARDTLRWAGVRIDPAAPHGLTATLDTPRGPCAIGS